MTAPVSTARVAADRTADAAWRGEASGKVIVFGEHAVVYGVPGIAAGIERGARATAQLALPSGSEDAGAATSSLQLGDTLIRSDVTETDLARAFSLLVGDGPPVRVVAEADLPPGGGLGCSAALAVAIARACRRARQQPEDETAVLAMASAWEGVFHGNPSGIDTAAAACGTFLRFVRGEGSAAILGSSDVWLVVGFSGKGASTREMVSGLADRLAADDTEKTSFLTGVLQVVERALTALTAGDAALLGELMNENQRLLQRVGISTDRIDGLCAAACQAGAFGAKLTGSGGGGSVIALVGAGADSPDIQQRASRVEAAFLAQDSTAFLTRIAGRPIPTAVSPIHE